MRSAFEPALRAAADQHRQRYTARATDHREYSIIDTVVYRFHDFSFDAAAYRLTRASEDVALEPLVAELLAVLIKERHRVVERGELFDRLWPNQLVSDSALSRLVYRLRKALDDAADSPQFIRTVPRRGVQFIANVTESKHFLAPQADPINSDPPDSGSSNNSPEQRGASQRSWSLTLVAVSVLAISAFVMLWIISEKHRPPELGRLVLLGSLGSGADAEGKLALLAVSDMLWVQLKDRLKIDVRSPRATTFGESVESVSDFARDNAADSVLALEVSRKSNTLVTPPGSFQLPALLADSDLLAFRLARDGIVSRLVDDTGHLLDATSQRLASSVEAWRLYLLARERLHQLSCGADDARALLERAVELDPDFALGWVALGFSHYNTVWACDGGREDARLALSAECNSHGCSSLCAGLWRRDRRCCGAD